MSYVRVDPGTVLSTLPPAGSVVERASLEGGGIAIGNPRGRVMKASRWKLYNRRVLVDRFQMRLAGVAIVHFFIVVFVFVAALFAPIVIDLVSGDLSSPRVQSAADEFLVLHNRIWMPLLGAIVLLVLHNVLMTHRIAGPLYRFRRYFKAVGEGDLSRPMEVRDRDYLRKDAEVISEMVESLRNRVALVAEQVERASEDWGRLRSSLPADAAEALSGKIDVVESRLEGCRRSATAFDLGSAVAPAPGEHDEPVVHPAELQV
jgi:methyl-accepting chemotaxis protein